MKAKTNFGILFIVFCFGCSSKNNTATKNISIIFNQTLQNEDVYPLIEIADSILAIQTAPHDSVSVKLNETNDDSSSSLLDRLSKGDDRQVNLSFEMYLKHHPLFAILQPNIKTNENDETTLAHSSFFGHSIKKDTSKVNKYLTTGRIRNLFPDDIKLFWSQSLFQDSIWSLSAINANGNTFYLDTADIESINIKKVELLSDSKLFEFIREFFNKPKFIINIMLNQSAINKMNRYSDYKSAFLVRVKLNDIEYTISLSIENLINGIDLGNNNSKETVESIKMNYKKFVIER